MSVKVTDNTAAIKIQTAASTNTFLRLFLEAVHDYADPNTPKNEGPLREGVIKRVTGSRGSIEWRKEYAAAQEVGTTRGFPMRNYTTGGTGKGFALGAVQKAVMQAEPIMKRARLII